MAHQNHSNGDPRVLAGADRIRAVLFDFDGTLVDTMGAFADLAGELIAAAHGWTFAEGRAAYLRTSGIPFFQQLEVLFPGDAGNAAMAQTFETRKLTAYDGRGLLPDVPPAIRTLQERGLKAVVSSNNFTDVVERFLATQDVGFDLVLGFGDGMHKGEPHFARTLEALDIPREALLFVGDSVRDGEIAHEAGLRFVARLGTAPREAFEKRFGAEAIPFVESLADLLALLDGAGPHSDGTGQQTSPS